MKTLTEYINDSLLYTDDILCNEDIFIDDDINIIDEGKISDAAKWLGDKIAKVNSTWHNLRRFGKKVKLAWAGFSMSLTEKDDALPKEERKKIVERVTNKKEGAEQIKELKQICIDYADNENAKNSVFMLYALLYGKQLSEEAKDTQSIKYFDSEISNRPDSTKNKAKKFYNDVKNWVNKKRNNGNDNDKEEKATTDKEKVQQEIKDKTEEVVEKPDVQKRAKELNIDLQVLKNEVNSAIWKIYVDNGGDIEEYTGDDKLVDAITDIILDLKKFNKEDFDAETLKKYHIDNIEEFIKKTSEKVNKK